MLKSMLVAIQQNVGRYGLSTLLICGNIGNFFTVVILGRSIQRRRNSCSIYLLSASLSNWTVINTGLVFNIIGIDHADPQHTSSVVCKLRWSGVHALLMLSRSFMIAACIDRWALCAPNVHTRAFSQPRVAIQVVIGLIIAWTVISTHMIVFFDVTNGQCAATPGPYALFYAIYSLLIIGVLPLLLMIVFNARAWCNLQAAHTRVAPLGRLVHIHKRDRDLLKMLTGEVFVYCLTTIPYPINLIYSVTTTHLTSWKSANRLAVESLISYIVSPLLNLMYCCAQFYVYLVCSRRFRKEFIRLFRRRRTNADRSGPLSSQ